MSQSAPKYQLREFWGGLEAARGVVELLGALDRVANITSTPGAWGGKLPELYK